MPMPAMTLKSLPPSACWKTQGHVHQTQCPWGAGWLAAWRGGRSGRVPQASSDPRTPGKKEMVAMLSHFKLQDSRPMNGHEYSRHQHAGSRRRAACVARAAGLPNTRQHTPNPALAPARTIVAREGPVASQWRTMASRRALLSRVNGWGSMSHPSRQCRPQNSSVPSRHLNNSRNILRERLCTIPTWSSKYA